MTVFFLSTSTQADSFTAILTGSQEVPPVSTTGSGTGTVTLNGNLLTINLAFQNLTSPTVDGHIHCCTPVGANAVVAIGFTSTGFPLGVTSGSYSNTFDLNVLSIYNAAFVTANGGTLTTARAAFISGLENGRTYLNVHTMAFPGGEIRGQVVPEPATMILLGTGLAAVAGRKLRRRRSE